MKIRPIAIYLPQFHPIPENDEWWGKGFTEWTNVTKAQPRFKGHYQPHLPADLGFYDLRLEESRLAQEKLAKEYSIYGFCYYHYWFNGKRVLNEPLDRKLQNLKEDLPFMMCWANENWSRRWDGSENDILLEQKYSPEDHRQHLEFLIPFFKDPRYIRIDNKVVFAVYRTSLIPNLDEAIKIWRGVANNYNLELYILRFEGLNCNGKEFMSEGVDAATEFQPLTAISRMIKQKPKIKGIKEEFSFPSAKNSINARITNLKQQLFNKNEACIYNYQDIINADFSYDRKLDYKLFSCVTPSWDNTSRKAKNYLVLDNSSPTLFRNWLDKKLKNFIPFSKEENLMFINAWNEWAEGNHLEPDRKWGTGYLEQLKLAINEHEKNG